MNEKCQQHRVNECKRMFGKCCVQYWTAGRCRRLHTYITRRQCDEGIEHATLMRMHLFCLCSMNLSHCYNNKTIWATYNHIYTYAEHFARPLPWWHAGFGVSKIPLWQFSRYSPPPCTAQIKA